MVTRVAEVEVVVAHRDRATLPVGDVFLTVDADRARTDVEVAAMALAPVPTPEIRWRRPPRSPGEGQDGSRAIGTRSAAAQSTVLRSSSRGSGRRRVTVIALIAVMATNG